MSTLDKLNDEERIALFNAIAEKLNSEKNTNTDNIENSAKRIRTNSICTEEDSSVKQF